jgi:hypothetical protein
MNWMSADLCGRDVRKIFAPKTVEYKRPRGRPPKYRGYDFDDGEQARDEEHGPAVVQTSWAQIGDGLRQIHPQDPDTVGIFNEWATEAWLHGEGGSVRADGTEELVAGWLAAGNELAPCPEFKRTRRYHGALPLPWFLKNRRVAKIESRIA